MIDFFPRNCSSALMRPTLPESCPRSPESARANDRQAESLPAVFQLLFSVATEALTALLIVACGMLTSNAAGGDSPTGSPVNEHRLPPNCTDSLGDPLPDAALLSFWAS